MAIVTTKPAPGRLILGPDTSHLADSVLATLHSANTRRSYARAIADLTAFAAGRPLTRMMLLKWRASMDKLSSSTINVRMSAARKLVGEAHRAHLIASDGMTDLVSVKGVPRRGQRVGNWLTPSEAKGLLAGIDRKTFRGKRNYCIIALLLGCALRRYELAHLQMETVQRRDGRWVLADLEGKGGRVRTVAVPDWVKVAIDAWTKAAGITTGTLIRRLSLAPGGLSVDSIWGIVKATAAKIGVHLGPHDLRRTCAKLCRARGGDLEQIRFMLGHASIQTTEFYLGSTQDLTHAVNDDLGL